MREALTLAAMPERCPLSPRARSRIDLRARGVARLALADRWGPGWRAARFVGFHRAARGQAPGRRFDLGARGVFADGTPPGLCFGQRINGQSRLPTAFLEHCHTGKGE